MSKKLAKNLHPQSALWLTWNPGSTKMVQALLSENLSVGAALDQ